MHTEVESGADSALDSGLASSLLMTEGVLVPCFLHVVKVKALVLFSEEVFFLFVAELKTVMTNPHTLWIL